MDYLKYHNLENYLFKEVRSNFRRRGYLRPKEFFCIIIWKANNEIFKTPDNKEKLRVLLEDWSFNLPMATAILTVLYPKNFTIYDVRVHNQLGIKDFSGRKNQVEKYFLEFLPKIRKTKGKNLRNKDRYLWGKSFYEDLTKFLKVD